MRTCASLHRRDQLKAGRPSYALVIRALPLLLSTSCTASTYVPNATLSCSADGDCPAGYLCRQSGDRAVCCQGGDCRSRDGRSITLCDPSNSDPGCGVGGDGEPRRCVAVRPLGGADFCADSCTPSTQPKPSDNGNVCAPPGARLASCDPAEFNSCGDDWLGCFRNNLLATSGVCLAFSPCSSDFECLDPVRSRCATTLVSQLYENPSAFQNDHLWCLQPNCQKNRSACSPGEVCLRDATGPVPGVPDICVAPCDNQLRCPPGQACQHAVVGPGAPAVCVPALLGSPCLSPLECLAGECLAVGAIGERFCTVTCTEDAHCARYDGGLGKFICNSDHQCVTPDSLRGAPCTRDAECRPGLTCARTTLDPEAAGRCLQPCDSAGACAPRAGVPHTCLSFATGRGCYPGYPELPCTSDDQCLPGLRCLPTGAGRPSICSVGCTTNADCAAVRWTSKATCQPVVGGRLCLSPQPSATTFLP